MQLITAETQAKVASQQKNFQAGAHGLPGAVRIMEVARMAVINDATGPAASMKTCRLRMSRKCIGAIPAAPPPHSPAGLNSQPHLPLRSVKRRGPMTNVRSFISVAQPANTCPSSWHKTLTKTAASIWRSDIHIACDTSPCLSAQGYHHFAAAINKAT